ncbi:unnamed protein product [Somion occarium]|uniref:Uncharacterized protein n=1 Tax=Somion occarium TaxID=3059160 RepID=A0ABP1EAA3_9APHY
MIHDISFVSLRPRLCHDGRTCVPVRVLPEASSNFDDRRTGNCTPRGIMAPQGHRKVKANVPSFEKTSHTHLCRKNGT